jgi:hypothetical protein
MSGSQEKQESLPFSKKTNYGDSAKKSAELAKE